MAYDTSPIPQGYGSLPIQTRTGNPYLDEIDQAAGNAHASLSPGAQEALKRAGAPVGIQAQQQPQGIQNPPTRAIPTLGPQSASPAMPEAQPSAQPLASSVPTTGIQAPRAPIQAVPQSAQEQQQISAAAPLFKGDTGQHNRQNTGTSGINQIHNPWGRVPLQILEALGTGFAPGLTSDIPGTQLHHNMLVNQAEGGIAEQEKIRKDQEEAQKEASEENLQGSQGSHFDAETNTLIPAQATEANARAWSLLNPQDKEKELTEFALWHKQNPDAPVSDWIKLKAQDKAVPEGEKPLAERVPQLNQAMQARYQILNKGRPLPPELTLPPNATQKDFDRVDKLLESQERSAGTLAQQQEAAAMRQQMYQLTAQNQATAALDRETQQYRTSHAKAVSDADAQLEKIQEAKAMLSSGSAEAQALAVPKVMTALISGQGSGVRITQPELNAIISARGIGGSFEAFMQKIQSGKKLTPDQAQQLQVILADAEGKIAQKQQIHNEALDKIGGAGNRNDIIKADQEARQRLGEFEKGGGGISQPKSKAEYEALPRGSHYMKNGQELVKQ